MSYDLYVARRDIPEDCLYDVCERHGDRHLVSRGRYFNYTYNLGRFFTAYQVNPIKDLNGLTGRECAGRIDNALRRIEQDDQGVLADLYNPDNNWGSVAGAVNWLRDIRDYCHEHPDYIVREES